MDENEARDAPTVTTGPAEGTDPAVTAAPGAPRRDRSPVRLVLAVMVVAAVVGAVALVWSRPGGDDADPDAVLAHVRDAVDEATSYRMTVTTEEATGDAMSAGPGVHSVMRVVEEVEVAGDNWRIRSDAGDWVDEAVAVDGTIYSRYGDDVRPIDGEQWAAWPADEDPALVGDGLSWIEDEIAWMLEDVPTDDSFLEEMLVSIVGPLYLGGMGESGLPAGPAAGGLIGDPLGFAAALADLDEAEVVADDGTEVTIRAVRRAPEELAEAAGRPLPDGVLEIVVGSGDLPVSARLTVEAGSARHESRIEFRDWSADITITAPDETDIDPTPWIDEEAMTAARAGITPLRPTDLPDGVEMQDIYPVPAEKTEEGCNHLNLVYGPPLPASEDLDDPAAFDAVMHDVDDGWLDVYLLPADCARQADPTPFAPGADGEPPTRTDEFGGVEVLIGDTVVQIDTTYTTELPALIGSIEPFDLDAELARLTAYAEAMWSTTGG